MSTKYDSFFHVGDLYLVRKSHFLHSFHKEQVTLKSGIVVVCMCNQHVKQHIAMLLTEDGCEVKWPELVDPEPYYKRIESCLQSQKIFEDGELYLVRIDHFLYSRYNPNKDIFLQINMRPGNLKPGELYTCNGPASNGSFIVWDMSSEEIDLETNLWDAKSVLADCKSKWMFLEVKQVPSKSRHANIYVYVFMATLFGGSMAAVLAGLDIQEVIEFIEEAHENNQ